MWLLESLALILTINAILYFAFKKYFGFVRTYLYWLIVAMGVFVGYMLDMQAFGERDYGTYITVGVVFALLGATCLYDRLFDKEPK